MPRSDWTLTSGVDDEIESLVELSKLIWTTDEHRGTC